MDIEYDSLRLKNQLCFPIYLCSKEIIRRYIPLLKKLDLTYTQYIVMMYFWERKTGNVRNISKALMLDSSTLTPLLKKLENKGYITRTRSSVDERNLDVTITNKGLELQERALSVPREMGKCLNLSIEEAETLYNLMYKILTNVERKK